MIAVQEFFVLTSTRNCCCFFLCLPAIVLPASLGLFAPQKLIPLLRAARDLSQPGRDVVPIRRNVGNGKGNGPWFIDYWVLKKYIQHHPTSCGCRHGMMR